MSAELLAVNLGRTLAKRSAQSWFASRRREQELGLDLGDLIRLRIPGLRAQRSVERQFEQIADAVAARLEPMMSHELGGIDDGERAAAVAALIDAFAQADLSDTAVFALDVDAAKLARQIRATVKPPVGLGDAATRVYDLLLAECCDCYIRILRHLPVFTERAIPELLNRMSELGAEISLVLERLPVRTLYAPQGSDQDEEFRREYLGLISRTLDEVELFSFATEQAARTKLSVAYISLRVSAASRASGRSGHRLAGRGPLLRTGLGEWENSVTESGVRVETALGEQRRVLVRGEAGSGKTTLLHWLAVTAARGAFTGDLKAWNGLIPIVIKLRSYAARDLPKPEEMLDGAAGPLTGHMPRAWVDRQFAAGRVLLMVDGVDELLPAERRKVREWLKLLLNTYPDTRALVTSRPAAAREGWLVAEKFSAVSLERMTPTDLSAFIRQWHQAVRMNTDALPCEPEELQNYERVLLASLRDRPHLQALASNPLLAGMLCALHLARRRQLPRNRMELYQIAVELLVQRRDNERRVPSAQELSLSLTDKIAVLRDLAWRLSDNNISELPREKALTHVTARTASMRHLEEAEPQRILDYLVDRSGVLRSPAEGRIDFVHRTFQEYLAAAEAAAEDRIGNLIGRAHLDTWRETIIMTVGHANRSQREHLINGILDRGKSEPRHARALRLLAVSCLETADSVPDGLSARLDQAIDKLLPPRLEADSLPLAALGDPLLRKLPTRLDGLSDSSAIGVVRAASLIGGKRALDLLAGYAGDLRLNVQYELMDAWHYFDSAEYADQVLTQLPLDQDDHILTLNHPAQWGPATALRHVKAIRIDYPVNLQELPLDELPDLDTLYLTNLIGAADLRTLSCQRGLRRLSCIGGGHDALENTSALADLTDLESLHLEGWSLVSSVKDIPITSRIVSLGLGNLSAGVEIDLNYLSSGGRLTGLFLGGHGKPHWVAAQPLVHELQYLDLGLFDLTDHVRDFPGFFPEVKSLTFYNCVLPGDVRELANCSQISGLRFYDCVGLNPAEIGFGSLVRQGFSNLTAVYVSNTRSRK